MMLGIALGLVAAMALMLARLFAGPTLYDRVLAVNSFGTKTVLFLAVFAFLIGRPDAIDIALLYALINFVATIAILKFFRFRAFSLALARSDSEATGASPSSVSDAST
jgi:multicomponent Na+:H+ antiporter subunit F